MLFRWPCKPHQVTPAICDAIPLSFAHAREGPLNRSGGKLLAVQFIKQGHLDTWRNFPRGHAPTNISRWVSAIHAYRVAYDLV